MAAVKPLSKTATAQLPQSTRGKVSALGVLAELETIEPILRKHQQETQAQLAQSLNPKIRLLLPSLGIKSTNEEDFVRIVGEISQETARQTLEDAARIQAPADATVVVSDSLRQTITTHPEIGNQIDSDPEELTKKIIPQIQEAVAQNQKALEQATVLTTAAQIASLDPKNPKTQSSISTRVEDDVRDKTALLDPGSREILKTELANPYMAAYQQAFLENLEIRPDSIPTIQQLNQSKEFADKEASKIGDRFAKSPQGKVIASRISPQIVTAGIAETFNLVIPRPRQQSKLPLIARVILSDTKRYKDLYLTALARDQQTLAKALKENAEKIAALKKKRSLTAKERKELDQAQKNYARYTNAQVFKVKKPRKFKQNLAFLSRIYTGRPELASQQIWQSEYYIQEHIPHIFAANERLAAGAAWGKLGFNIAGFNFGSMFSSIKGQISGSSLVSMGMGMTPTGVISRFGGKIRNIAGAAFAGIMLYLLQLGQAAAMGAIVGAAIGGLSGAAIGFLAPPILWPVTVPLGFFVGGSMGGIAGAMTALGLATGSTTLATTGIGMTVGTGVGAVVGFALGGPIGAAIGAFLGYFAGAAIGYAAGQLISAIGLPASGALAGAAIGFYIGGPLGALVGAGVGWLVAGGANQIKNFLSSGAAVGGGFLSTIGGFIKGAISTAAGIVSGGISGAFGLLSGAANFIVGGLSSLSIPSAGTVVLLTAGPVGIAGISSVLVITATAVSFATIAQDEPTEITIPGENQFFTLTKTAQPQTLDNSDLPSEIKFTITLKAKSTNLTNIQITDELKVQKQSGTFTVTTDKDGRPISPPCPDTAPSSLPANDTWVCKFIIIADIQPPERDFSDSLVANTVTVKTTPEGQSEITDSNTATVVIGTPPTLCAFLDIQGSWSQAERNNINEVCKTLDRSPAIISLLRNAGTIGLVKGTPRDDGVCGTVNGARTVTIYCDMSSLPFAKYVIIHELGHVLGNYNFSLYNSFISVYEQEGLMPTYPFQGSGPSESFAEMITEYVVSKEYNHPARSWSEYPGGPWVNPGPGWTTFQSDRSLHFNFARDQIYGGVSY